MKLRPGDVISVWVTVACALGAAMRKISSAASTTPGRVLVRDALIIW